MISETSRLLGLSLFVQAANLFSYLALGVPEMGRRGRFKLCRAEAVNPLTGEQQLLLDAAQGPLFQVPNILVTGELVREWVDGEWQAASDELQLAIRFLTPMRIVSQGKLVHTPQFAPLFARLFDRLKALSTHYAAGELLPDGVKPDLMALADQVQLAEEQSRWREAHSYSCRQKRRTPLKY